MEPELQLPRDEGKSHAMHTLWEIVDRVCNRHGIPAGREILPNDARGDFER